ncbi:MAG: hypothetical protein HY925_14365 [Elusimicrobia bacterium]|nr:hypothetical protein [Elusimicrobiota bacterium]
MPSLLTSRRSALLLAALVLLSSPARSATQAERKPQDSAAALAFTKQPLRAWWEGLPEPERRSILAKDARLALSFDSHKKVMTTAAPGVIMERALRDWWDGTTRLRQESLLREHPKLRDAFAEWRKRIDDWTARERRAQKPQGR